MQRRLMVAGAIALASAAFLSGSGRASSAAMRSSAHAIPAGLADAIHARFGAGELRSGSGVSATNPFFGFAVVLSADATTALVGADGVGNYKGAVYVYHVSSAGSWASTATPTATLMSQPGPAGQYGEFFGRSIALSADGTTAVVGAPLAGTGTAIGRIYVFHVSAESAWASTSTPTATLKVNHDLVGDAVALSSDGTTLVVGTDETGPAGLGGAYVFHASSESAWVSTSTPTATLSNAAESSQDGLTGSEVGISGDGTTAILSDSQNESGGDAYIYHVASETSWTTSSTPTAILSDANIAPKGYLGWSVALSGDGTVALLGAPTANGGEGAVDVFHTATAAAWASTSTPTATLTKPGGSKHDALGSSVSMSTDGATALVADPGLGGNRGGAQIFHVANEGAWATSSSPTATLTNSASHTGDVLGAWTALSADGATALVGAPGVRFNTGAADAFHAADAGSWAATSTPNATLTAAALNACVVPRLKGLTVSAAKSALKKRSCRLGKISRVHAKGKKGRVVSQSLQVGSRPHVGTKIAVKVAK